jgi:hypothetical protein
MTPAELTQPNLFFTLVLPVVLIVVVGLIGLALATRPHQNQENPLNPGGSPWKQQ